MRFHLVVEITLWAVILFILGKDFFQIFAMSSVHFVIARVLSEMACEAFFINLNDFDMAVSIKFLYFALKFPKLK